MDDNCYGTLKKAIEVINDMRNIQGADGNWDHCDYMRGMYNALEACSATLEERKPVFKTADELKIRMDKRTRRDKIKEIMK